MQIFDVKLKLSTAEKYKNVSLKYCYANIINILYIHIYTHLYIVIDIYSSLKRCIVCFVTYGIMAPFRCKNRLLGVNIMIALYNPVSQI